MKIRAPDKDKSVKSVEQNVVPTIDDPEKMRTKFIVSEKDEVKLIYYYVFESVTVSFSLMPRDARRFLQSIQK
jgi:hypothetical protein